MRTYSLSLRLFVFFLLRLFAGVLASDITSFTDAKCTRSWRALDAVNGYPDGLCKPLNVTGGQSFQIQELDPGCAGKKRLLYCELVATMMLIVGSYAVWRERWAFVLFFYDENRRSSGDML